MGGALNRRSGQLGDQRASGDGALDPLHLFRLDGRVAIVTGASSGLGARAARVLDALGATVVVAARRLDRLEQLAARLADGHAAACDVSVAGASAELVDRAVDRHGRVDVVISCAGIATPGPALRTTRDEFAEVVAVDLLAPFELAQAAARHMRGAGGGSIVNVASLGALKSSPLAPDAGYISAKTGLLGLTRELALQWARYGIRVNAICPGMFPSEMSAAVVESDELRARYEGQIAFRRLGHAHELDGTFALLASDASSYITGQALVVDGGFH